jgi:hypothetical protein
VATNKKILNNDNNHNDSSDINAIPSGGDDGGLVNIRLQYTSGPRDAFWIFADKWKAAILRSGRLWRKKRK